jgi:hypothetical protein
MASELAAARERYRKHLAAKKENDSPYHTSYGKSFLAGTWRDDLIADDEALLARSACDGDGERDAARYRYVRETCYITFGGYGVKGDALDEAVDAAIAAKGAGE